MKTSDLSIACLQAYVDKARDAAEAIIADDFSFTSPLDNALDRSTYFERCWPNSKFMTGVRIIEAVDRDDRAFVIYEAASTSDRQIRLDRDSSCRRPTSSGNIRPAEIGRAHV